MNPRPIFEDVAYKPSCKLLNKAVLISGGDIGNENFCQQAVAEVIQAWGKLDLASEDSSYVTGQVIQVNGTVV